MHAEVVEDACFAAGGVDAFPVCWFRGVEVAGVVEAGDDFEGAADGGGEGELVGALGSGKKGHFGGDTHEAAGFLDDSDDTLCGGEIDAEGFLGKEVFPGAEDIG